DTSNYTPHQLRHIIVSAYGRSDAARQGLGVTLISFGYKFGTPHEVDLMFDVRFLPNPYFVQELKALKGTDREVSGFVMEREETKAFLDRVHSLLDFLIPQFIAEGRAYLVVGIGCTGGRHRSPAVIQALSEHIKRTHGITPGIIHRDIDL
ncbi:MAG TPA: RNase adapter RapZ, partial [Dissulfurispiraceae bacterium]